MKSIKDIMPNGKTRLQHNLYNSKWSKNNRDKANIYSKNWRRKRMDWYFSLKKDKKCKLCKESHPACLDYHHENPKEKEWSVKRLVLSTSDNKAVLREISKCIIVCANCHRKIHYKG